MGCLRTCQPLTLISTVYLLAAGGVGARGLGMGQAGRQTVGAWRGMRSSCVFFFLLGSAPDPCRRPPTRRAPRSSYMIVVLAATNGATSACNAHEQASWPIALYRTC